jgi:hypothetical protein
LVESNTEEMGWHPGSFQPNTIPQQEPMKKKKRKERKHEGER